MPKAQRKIQPSFPFSLLKKFIFFRGLFSILFIIAPLISDRESLIAKYFSIYKFDFSESQIFSLLRIESISCTFKHNFARDKHARVGFSAFIPSKSLESAKYLRKCLYQQR